MRCEGGGVMGVRLVRTNRENISDPDQAKLYGSESATCFTKISHVQIVHVQYTWILLQISTDPTRSKAIQYKVHVLYNVHVLKLGKISSNFAELFGAMFLN